MAITDIDISEKLIGDAPSIKYEGDMRTDRSTPPWERENPWDEDPKDQVIDEETTIRVASDPSWGAEWEDIYQDYKIKQIELGQEFISKEEFIDMHRDHGEASPVIGGEETMQVASHEGNDAWMEKRMEQLMDGGMDWASAAKQAQEEARSGNVPEPMATGGRAHFGLGSIFKSVGKAAKKFVKSPIGKAALLGLGAYGANAGWFGKGMSGWAGKVGPSLFGTPAGTGIGALRMGAPASATEGLLGKWGLTKGAGSMMPTALGWGAGAVGAVMAAAAFEGMDADEVKALRSNPDALRAYLKQYHSNTHPDKKEKDVDIWVEQNMYSTGGRVSFGGGGRGWQAQLKAEDIAQEDYGQEFYSLSNAQQHKVYNKALVEIDDMLSEKADMMRKNEAQGGRIGYDNGGDVMMAGFGSDKQVIWEMA